MSPRTVSDVQADIARLARPRMPVPATSPAVLQAWRFELESWRAATPDGDTRYEALLAEWDTLEAEAKKHRELEAWGERAGIPQRTLRAALSAREEAPILLTREWLATSKTWLVLMGGVGTGKSVAAAWALLQSRPKRCMWETAVGLAARAGGFDGQTHALRLKGCDVLVVDDLGVEHSSEFGRSVLAEVLLHRHEEGLSTVLTTNLSGAAFRERVGERLADRIRGDCATRAFGGDSLRGGGK